MCVYGLTAFVKLHRKILQTPIIKLYQLACSCNVLIRMVVFMQICTYMFIKVIIVQYGNIQLHVSNTYKIACANNMTI